MSEQNSAKCPECGKKVEVDSYNELGDEVICDHCEAELEIIKLNPPKLRSIGRNLDEDEENYDQMDYGSSDRDDEDYFE